LTFRSGDGEGRSNEIEIIQCVKHIDATSILLIQPGSRMKRFYRFAGLSTQGSMTAVSVVGALEASISSTSINMRALLKSFVFLINKKKEKIL
jgi:hypothetical protein